MILADFIEYNIMNGIGYNTKTDFTRGNPKTLLFKKPLMKSEIRASKYAVRAHLAHLERNVLRLRAVSLFNPLRNAPENYLFQMNNGKSATLNHKQRRRIRKAFVIEISYYRKIMNLEISCAQDSARWNSLKSGKDLGFLIEAYSLQLSQQKQ